MSGRTAEPLIESVIEGLVVCGVNVTSEIREMIDERVATGLAKAMPRAKGGKTIDESNQQFSDGFFDSWHGVLYHTEGGGVIERMSRWPERERVIANGFCLAAVSGRSYLHLYDVAMLWPQWFRRATRHADLADLWSPCRWQIEQVFARIGYSVRRVGKRKWQMLAIDDSRCGVTLSATVAADNILKSLACCQDGEYEAAVQLAIKAIDRCPIAQPAHRLIAELSRNGCVEIDRVRQVQSAMALHDRQESIVEALDQLKALSGAGRGGSRTDWIAECLGRFEEELAVTAPMCSWAEQILDAAIAEGDASDDSK